MTLSVANDKCDFFLYCHYFFEVEIIILFNDT